MDLEAPQGMSINAKIILGCTITLIIFLSGAMIFMWKHIEELTASPFTYGAKKTSQAYQGSPVMCTCQVETYGKPGQQFDNTFGFNTTHVWNGDYIGFPEYVNINK